MMTGIRIALFAVVLSSSALFGATTENGLDWKKNYGTAKDAAQAARCPLVVVIENSEVAGEKLDDERMTEENRLKIKQKKFELCRVDISTKYGKLVAEAFGAKKLPFVAISDRSTKSIVFRKSGQMNGADWSTAIAKSSTVPAVGQRIVMDSGAPVSGGYFFSQPIRSAVQCFT
jgi:hypothetical protein